MRKRKKNKQDFIYTNDSDLSMMSDQEKLRALEFCIDFMQKKIDEEEHANNIQCSSRPPLILNFKRDAYNETRFLLMGYYIDLHHNITKKEDEEQGRKILHGK